MKVLLPAAEVAPIIKFGGLGDVVGSLPKALEKIGVNVDVIVPFYPSVNLGQYKIYKSIDLNVPYNNKNNPVEIYNTKIPGSNVDVLLIKEPYYFSFYGKEKKDGDISDAEAFSFFDRGVVEYVKSRFNTYDLVHCNDWHTGLITHILSDEIGSTRPATLFTIHNLLYQGIEGASITKRVGIEPNHHPTIYWDIIDGDLNMLQQGITSADYISTVSPSYAKEILTPEFGGQMADILESRKGRLDGILNGIDYSGLPRNYDEKNFESKKSETKKELIETFKLDISIDKPIFSFIGRIDQNQKGMDILIDVIPYIIKQGGAFILIGVGNKIWEEKYRDIIKMDGMGGRVSINIKHDNDLANKIYSGSDFLIVPSKYEPCGLIQLIAMWYGTLPIVRNVGGLKDSVIDGTSGIIFDKYSSADLLLAVGKAFKLYSGQGYKSMSINAMRQDFGWDKSAIQYKNLYEKVISLRLEAVNLRNTD